MKKITTLIALSFFFLITPVFASCSLGATPLSASARAKSGNTVVVTWNLYNMYGDRNTYVNIDISGDTDWEITIDPQKTTWQFDIAGQVREVSGNLYLMPKPAVEVYPLIIPAGENYIKHPFRNAFIPVSVVKIYITIPEGVPAWETHTFRATATGECFSETSGNLATQITSNLDINIETVPEAFYESMILTVPWYIEYLPVIVTLAVLVALLALLQLKPEIWRKLKTKKAKRK